MSTYKEILSRRERIYELIMEYKSIGTDKLSSLLSVSRMTIRRDLENLAEKGGIQKVHGGVTLKKTNKNEPPYMIRSLAMKREKDLIGYASTSEVSEKELIFIDVGSTLLSFVRHLISSKKEVAIITPWIPVVLECQKNGHQNVTLLGGKVDTKELSIFGGYPEEMLKEYIADKLFLGVAGISLKYGLTDYKMEEIRVKRQMIESAKKVIVLADHSKFNHIAPIKICELNAVNKIITDRGISKSLKVAVESLGVEVSIADNNVQNE